MDVVVTFGDACGGGHVDAVAVFWELVGASAEIEKERRLARGDSSGAAIAGAAYGLGPSRPAVTP